MVESERVAQRSWKGVVEEVIAEEPPRLRVRWGDGHTKHESHDDGGASAAEAGAEPGVGGHRPH